MGYLTSQMRTVDTALLLKDAGLVAASAAAQVGGVAKILDIGASIPSTGAIIPEMNGVVVIDVTAIESDSANEKFTITLQASSSSTFASDIANLCSIELGVAATLLGGGTVAGATGRYFLPFNTNRNGTTRRYLRLYTTVVGTIATGINYTAFLAKHSGM